MAVEPAADDSLEGQSGPARQRLSAPSLIAGERVSDELLARLVASGGERPFKALYERYRHPLYGYCHSILRNEADAQDALQSTFTKALMALREGRRNAPLRPWLYRIAHNEAVSIVRDRGTAEKRLERVPRRADAPSVEERAGDRARLSSLLEDLSQLPDRARGALVMREMGGLSHEEIATAMGLSIGAAKQAIFEARRGLLELAEGRAMSCDDITRRLSAGDRRAFRGRRVRAHLRDCGTCAAFAAAIPRRQGELRALAPVLAPVSAAAVLDHILSAASGPPSSSAAGSAAAGGSALAGGSGAPTAGLAAKALVSAVAPKALLAVVVSAGVAAGGVAVGVSAFDPAHHPTTASSHARGTGRSSRRSARLQATANAGGAARSDKQRGGSQPMPGAHPGRRTDATRCSHCPTKPSSHDNARNSHPSHPPYGRALGHQNRSSPGASSHSSSASSHVSAGTSHAAALAAHAEHAGANHANPRSRGHGNPHPTHPAGRGKSRGRGHH
jgi:RNA polymerase sigma factor (sigma-70 family)